MKIYSSNWKCNNGEVEVYHEFSTKLESKDLETQSNFVCAPAKCANHIGEVIPSLFHFWLEISLDLMWFSYKNLEKASNNFYQEVDIFYVDFSFEWNIKDVDMIS